MKKIISIIIAVIILAIVVFAIYYFMQSNNKKQNLETAKNAGILASNPTAKMPETNPFAAKVNPMDGYTNPFDK